MKKLLFLIFPLFSLAQVQEYFVNGVNINDIDAKLIEIRQMIQTNPAKAFIDYGQDAEWSELVIKDVNGEEVKFRGAIKVLNLFKDYKLVASNKLTNAQQFFYLERKQSIKKNKANFPTEDLINGVKGLLKKK